MTDYSDVPAVNALYMENQSVNNAITLIDSGGQMSMFTVSPGPPDSENMMPQMAMSIVVPPPVNPALMIDLRQWLVDRSLALEEQLADLGVTDPPVVKREPPPAKTASEDDAS